MEKRIGMGWVLGEVGLFFLYGVLGILLGRILGRIDIVFCEVVFLLLFCVLIFLYFFLCVYIIYLSGIFFFC